MRFNFSFNVNPTYVNPTYANTVPVPCNPALKVTESTGNNVVTKRYEFPDMNISGNVECSVKDLADLWDLEKKVLAESPEVVEEFMKSTVDKIGIFKELIGRIEDMDKSTKIEETVEAVPDNTKSEGTGF